MGRIGDFGIAKSVGNDHCLTETHLYTEHGIGTLVHMATECKNGQVSLKADTFAFGLVIVEALTGHAVSKLTPGFRNLLVMFEDELDTISKLSAHLEKHADCEYREE